MRSSRAQMFLSMAREGSKRSTCCRLNVGAIVVINNSPVANGYNGPPSGEPHCLGNDCPLSSSGGCTRSLHAEANALDKVPKEHALSHKELYVTHSPCPTCVEKILHHNVTSVCFETEYRDISALQKLIDRGIKVCRVTPSGYTIDLATNKIEIE